MAMLIDLIKIVTKAFLETFADFEHKQHLYSHEEVRLKRLLLLQTSQNERIVPINRVESAPPSQTVIKTPEIVSPLSTSSTPSSPAPSQPSQPPERLLPSTWNPPVIQTFPRRTPQPTASFRPPSLHLPGKEEIPK